MVPFPAPKRYDGFYSYMSSSIACRWWESMNTLASRTERSNFSNVRRLPRYLQENTGMRTKDPNVYGLACMSYPIPKSHKRLRTY
jgi:hypothetical protein